MAMEQIRQLMNRRGTSVVVSTLRGAAESDALFWSIGEGAIATDENGNVSRINQHALDILGFRVGDVLGKWYPGIIVAEDEKGKLIPPIDRPISAAFLSGKPVFERLYYRCKDGSKVPVALTVAPVLLNTKPIGAIEIFRDISEEVNLENAKDEFIAVASHQLRTPATIVKQYIGMMIEGYAGKFTRNQMNMLKIAYENNDHQIDIVNDLLKVAQADANSIKMVEKEVDVVQLLEDIVTEQGKKFEDKSLSINLKSGVDSAVYLVDPLHIRMIVNNLLDNAYKYTPEGKSVAVELSFTKRTMRIKIIDSGVGIDKKDIPKLFQRFSRVQNPLSVSAGGTGLGLYWAKKLVALHGGDITVTSRLQRGTIFTVKLPIKPA